jgi:hypothetical protein
VPRITPNTVPKPAPAPSVASDKAKQSAFVGEADGTVERRLQIAAQRPTGQPGRVGVLDQPGGTDNGARDADADRGGAIDLDFEAGNEPGNRRDRAVIVAARRDDSPTRPKSAVGSKGNRLDFASAEVDTDAKYRRHAPLCR